MLFLFFSVLFAGVGYRPMPHDSKVESTLIHFRDGSYESTWGPWVDRLDEYLKDGGEQDTRRDDDV